MKYAALHAPPPETNTARHPHFVATDFVVNKLHSKSSAHGALQRGCDQVQGIHVAERSRYLFEPLGCNQNICFTRDPILLAKMSSWIRIQRQIVRETSACLLRFIPYPLYLKIDKHASNLQPRPRRQRHKRTAFSGPVSDPGAAAAQAVSDGAREISGRSGRGLSNLHRALWDRWQPMRIPEGVIRLWSRTGILSKD